MLLQVSCVEALAEMGADGLISAVFYTWSNEATPCNANQEEPVRAVDLRNFSDLINRIQGHVVCFFISPSTYAGIGIKNNALHSIYIQEKAKVPHAHNSKVFFYKLKQFSNQLSKKNSFAKNNSID